MELWNFSSMTANKVQTKNSILSCAKSLFTILEIIQSVISSIFYKHLNNYLKLQINILLYNIL